MVTFLIESMSVCPCICLSHPIYSEMAKPIDAKFGENVWSVDPFTYSKCRPFVLSLKGASRYMRSEGCNFFSQNMGGVWNEGSISTFQNWPHIRYRLKRRGVSTQNITPKKRNRSRSQNLSNQKITVVYLNEI